MCGLCVLIANNRPEHAKHPPRWCEMVRKFSRFSIDTRRSVGFPLVATCCHRRRFTGGNLQCQDINTLFPLVWGTTSLRFVWSDKSETFEPSNGTLSFRRSCTAICDAVSGPDTCSNKYTFYLNCIFSTYTRRIFFLISTTHLLLSQSRSLQNVVIVDTRGHLPIVSRTLRIHRSSRFSLRHFMHYRANFRLSFPILAPAGAKRFTKLFSFSDVLHSPHDVFGRKRGNPSLRSGFRCFIVMFGYTTYRNTHTSTPVLFERRKASQHRGATFISRRLDGGHRNETETTTYVP